MSFYLFFFAGFLAGIPGGMGMGGGTVLIPLLTVALGVGQRAAQTANLVSFLPMAAVSLKIHYDNGLLRLKNILYVIIPALLFSVLGAAAARALPVFWLRKAFGAFLCVLSFFQFFSARKLFTKREKRVKI